MSDYFSANISLTINVAALAVDVSTKDRIVYLPVGGSFKIGFSSSTCVFIVSTSTNPISLPAGEQLWMKENADDTVPIVVSKSPSSVTLCG